MPYRVSVLSPDGAALWSTTAGAILLDLDGTLVDTTAAVVSSWRSTAASIGVPFADVEPYMHGIPADQVLDRVAPHLAEEERARVAAEVLRVQSDPGSPVDVLPGAAELLDSLGQRHWAIVTSGDARLASASMRKAGIPQPPVLVTADDVTRGKPDPEPYLRAATLLGVPPSECLVIEDSPAGVRAGRAAGMTVLALTTTHAAGLLDSAHHVLASLGWTDDAELRIEVLPAV
jgi:sugar-phosphatase